MGTVDTNETPLAPALIRVSSADAPGGAYQSGPVAWRWPLTDNAGRATETYDVTTNERYARLLAEVDGAGVQPLYAHPQERGELLEALRSLLHYCEHGATNTRLLELCLNRARGAVAKATGAE